MSPASLASIQGVLTEVLQRSQPIAGDPEVEPRAATIAAGNARLSPAEQIDIYREQFWLRHRDSLREDYPALEHIMGDDAFETFARAFLVAVPPRTPSLRDLGNDIVPFAEGYAFPQGTREAAMDAVRYERAFVDAFDGPDPPPLDPAVIAAVQPEAWNDAVLVLNPCVARLHLHHRIPELHYSLAAKEPPPPVVRIDDGHRVVLFRERNVVRFEVLGAVAFDLLELLAQGVPLVPACARLTEGKTEAEIASLQGAIGGWFAGWARAGFIARIDLPEAAP